MGLLKKFNVLFVLFLFCSLNVSADFAGGTGSLASPYQITNLSNLQLMGNFTGANFSLQNDIDASATLSWNLGRGFIPIGNLTRGNFTGTFFGNGYAISNLFINRSSESGIGLFGLTEGASFFSIHLVNATIVGNNSVGSLVGDSINPLVVNDSSASGRVEGENYVGGLVGKSYYGARITNSYATSNIEGIELVGGLVGYAVRGLVVENSYATGIVNASYTVGGLVGQTEYSNISYSYATGNVIEGIDNIGGLIGYSGEDAILYKTYATGNVFGEDRVGGLVGEAVNGLIANESYALGNVRGVDYVGGLLGRGRHYEDIITQSYAIGNVSGTNYVGGLIGRSYYESVDNVYATGNVNGSTQVGGLIGQFSSYYSSTLENSYATGNVNGTSKVGGLVGYTYSVESDPIFINNSFATGEVSASSQRGGLIGNGTDLTVTNVYWVNSSSNPDSCLGNTSVGCSSVSGSSYFYESSNAPLTLWNFTDIWVECSSDFPALVWQNKSGCSFSSGSGPSGSQASSVEQSRRTSSGSYTSKSLTLSSKELELGVSRSGLWRGDKVRLDLSEGMHTITIEDFDRVLGGGWVTLVVASEPQKFNLSMGEEINVDVFGDSNYDLLIGLEEIVRNRVSIFVKQINVNREGVQEVLPESVVDPVVIESSSKSSSGIWFVILLLILLIVALGSIIFFKFRK